MDNDPPDDKRCTEQHFQYGGPTAEWLPEQLIAYVHALKAAIDDDERGLAIKYWRMGIALNLLRRSFNRGHWERFLIGAKLDKTKASRARAIARTFEKESDLAGLTVRDAYGKRARKPHPQAPATATRSKQPRLARFFQTVAREADALADEAGFAEQAAAAELLSAAEAALVNVQRLRDLLLLQAGGQA